MARRDVDLVVRARDEAAKVIESITKAVKDFTEGQTALESRAGKTESSLSKLGAAFATLDKSISGIAGIQKMSENFDKARGSYDKLRESVEKGRAEFSKTERDLRQAEAALTRYTEKLRGAEAAFNRQERVTKRAQQAQRDLSREYDRTVAAQQRAIAAQDKLPQQIERQAMAVARAEANYRRLESQINSTTEPTRRLQASFESSITALQRQEERLRSLQTRYLTLNGEIARSSEAMTRMRGSIATANTDVARNEAILGRMGQNYERLRMQVAASEQNQRKLATEVARTGGALAAQEGQLQRARNEMARYAGQTKEADQALARLAQQGAGALRREFLEQVRSLKTAETAYKQMTEVVSRMAAEIGRVGVPTRKMAEDFARAKISAAQAKTEFQQQQVMVHRLRQTYAEMGGSLASVEQTQRRFTGIQQQTRSAMQETAAAADRKRAALQAIYGSATQAANANLRLASSANQVAGATRQATQNTLGLRDAYNQLYGGSRQSLSLLQRIRGEVLALTASYIGLFAAFRGINNVVGAIQRLEAAQSRLNVIFDGDEMMSARELDFIRRNADRLGIAFGDLADLYTKFAVASRGTRLEGEATRDIFIAVAEAARVNKAPLDKIRLTFLALEQMVSKGTVQMEELRRQLGDQLPGAFQLMADAAARAGLITDRFATRELSDLIQNGQLSSDILITFAEVLRERFGPGLEAALNTTTTAIGRFQNAAFQATLAIGRGNFERAIIDLLNALSETISSGRFISMMERLGNFLATMANMAQLAAENFRVLAVAAGIFIGIKLTPFIIGVIGSLINMATGLRTVATSATTAGASLTALRAQMAATTSTAQALRVALAAPMVATGIGLAVSLIGAGLALWATRTNDATEALVDHRRMLDEIKNLYEAVNGELDTWRERLTGVNETALRGNLDQLREQYREMLRDLTRQFDWREITLPQLFTRAGRGALQAPDAVRQLVAEFERGDIKARQFRDELNSLAESVLGQNDAFDRAIRTYVSTIDRLIELEDAIGANEDALVALTGESEEAEAALRRLNGVVEEVIDAEAEAARRAEEYAAALGALGQLVPGVAEELKRLEDIAKLEAARDAALELADNYGQVVEVLRLFERGLDSINSRANNLEGFFSALRFGAPTEGYIAGGRVPTQRTAAEVEELVRATTDLARQMGLNARDLLAVMSFETGGTLDPWQAGPTTRWGQHRGLIQWGEPQRARYGVSESSTITEQVMAAGRYLADAGVQAGDGIAQVYAAILAGDARRLDASDIAAGGVVRNVTEAVSGEQFRGHIANADAMLAAYSGVVQQMDEAAREAERRAEQERRFNETIGERIASQEFELGLMGQATEEAEVARAIRQAELEAQRAGTQLTAEQRAELERVTRERVRAEEAARRQQEIERGNTEEMRRARAAQEEVNQLTAQRAAMVREMAMAEEQGDRGRVEELRGQLQEVNQQLIAAIDNAMRMWEAVGGQAATTAIAQLRTARYEAQNFANEADNARIKWERVADLLVNGLTRAFDQFARSVAEGKSVGEAAREAFLQFAADFLIEIGKMIVQQMILNMLRAAFGGTPFGAMIGLGHTGGLVGSSRVGSGNSSRRVDPGMFAGAMRYHTGGIVGLRPGEVPIIAKKNEEVLTEDDPRHMFNASGQSGAQQSKSMKIVNAFDAADMLNEALGSAEGEEVFINYVRRNATAIRSVLG